MKYLSLHTETTGLDRDLDQVIEIGAIIEDTNNPLPFDEIPKFHAIVKHDRYSGGAYAINMNARVFKILAERVKIRNVEEKYEFDFRNNICSQELVALYMYSWMVDNLMMTSPHWTWKDAITVTVAGKNIAAFDMPFLNRLPEFKKLFRFRHRMIDPATLYWNPMLDTELPSLEQCLERAGLPSEVVHDAVQDAWQVVQVLRKKY